MSDHETVSLRTRYRERSESNHDRSAAPDHPASAKPSVAIAILGGLLFGALTSWCLQDTFPSVPSWGGIRDQLGPAVLSSVAAMWMIRIGLAALDLDADQRDRESNR